MFGLFCGRDKENAVNFGAVFLGNKKPRTG
jgi:hypothetical protein